MTQTDLIEAVPADEIGVAGHPRCAICGGVGRYLYLRQPDRLFGAPGLWNIKRCSTEHCGLIWLDPMPLPGEIGKAYKNYYTHAEDASSARFASLRTIYRRIKQSYIAQQWGYPQRGSRWIQLGAKFFRFFPVRRSDADQEIRFLVAKPGGNLLDVGCGSGQWLLRMRDLGWTVEGVDFDPAAVQVAQSQCLAVQCGALETQQYPVNCFDALTLNHVIEHVPDPRQTVQECFRILKPGGTLVIATPNSSSLSHKLFGKNWRGLEPPRHLHIFSAEQLGRLIATAGFQRVQIHPHVAESVIRESLQLASARGRGTLVERWLRKVCKALFIGFESVALRFKPQWGDCVVVVATK